MHDGSDRDAWARLVKHHKHTHTAGYNKAQSTRHAWPPVRVRSRAAEKRPPFPPVVKGESMLGRGGAAAPARFGIPSTLTSSLARIRAPAELLAAMAAARFLAPT
jgi:hypothetical protein